MLKKNIFRYKIKLKYVFLQKKENLFFLKSDCETG